ncbi:hypothetical protein E8E11_008223 [Didymella keratinophila]|nr:hypothetical protein E8E11_008223 [Didymella keratinophila]
MADPLSLAASVVGVVSTTNRILRSTRDGNYTAQQLQSLEEATEHLKIYEAHAALSQDEQVRQSVLDSRIALLALAESIRRLEDDGSRTKKIMLRIRRPYFQREIDNAQRRLDILLRQLSSTFLEHFKSEVNKASSEKKDATSHLAGDHHSDTDEVPYEEESYTSRDDTPASEEQEGQSEIEGNPDDPNGSSTGIDGHHQSNNPGLTRRVHHYPPTIGVEPFSVPDVSKGKTTYSVLKFILEDVIVHKVTIYTVFVSLIIGSTVTTGLAAWTSKAGQTISTNQLGSDFFSAVSSNLGTILGVFCTIVPLLERNRQHQPDIAAWSPQTFRWSLVISIFAAILSMTIQTTDQASSLILGYISTASQLIATLSLVIGSTHRITEHRREYEFLSTRHWLTSINLMNMQRR